jgi:hypothetical protein
MAEPLSLDDDEKAMDLAARSHYAAREDDEAADSVADEHMWAAETLRGALAFLVGRRRFSDCCFAVGADGVQIPAHRAIVASASPVFEAMLLPNLLCVGEAPNPREPIVLREAEPKAFRALLQWIYTREAGDVSATSVVACLRVAKRYCVWGFEAECRRFVQTSLSAATACAFFNHASELGLSESSLLEAIERDSSALEQPSVLDLTRERLRALLSKGAFRFAEERVFHAVMEWGRAEARRQGLKDSAEGVRAALGDVLMLVRLPLLTMQQFATKVVPTRVLDSAAQLTLYKYIASNGTHGGEEVDRLGFIRVPRGARAQSPRVTLDVANAAYTKAAGSPLPATRIAWMAPGKVVARGSTPLPKYDACYIEFEIVSTAGELAVGLCTQAMDVERWNLSHAYVMQGDGKFRDRFRIAASRGRPLAAGDVVGLLASCAAGKLVVTVNGEPLPDIRIERMAAQCLPVVMLETGAGVAIVPPDALRYRPPQLIE